MLDLLKDNNNKLIDSPSCSFEPNTVGEILFTASDISRYAIQSWYPTYFTIAGKNGKLVEISLDTGKVTITGDIDEATRTFWEAVQRYLPPCQKCREARNG